MFSSVKKRVFDLVVGKLNGSTQDVVFDGNFMFKFIQGDTKNFEIITQKTDYLDFQSQEIVPVVDAQNIQVPFVDKNERDDFEREFYIAIEVPSTIGVNNQVVIEFQESNPTYQAILETIETFKSDLTFVEGDYKYTFKVKEPTQVNYWKYNSKYYQLVAFTLNLTSLKFGYFGNETQLYLGLKTDELFDKTSDYELDFLQFTPSASKETRPNSLAGATENNVAINKRTWFVDLTVNFRGNLCDMLLQREVDAVVDNDLIYQLTVVKNTLSEDLGETYEYTRDVYVTTSNATYTKNDVDTITIRLERA